MYWIGGGCGPGITPAGQAKERVPPQSPSPPLLLRLRNPSLLPPLAACELETQPCDGEQNTRCGSGLGGGGSSPVWETQSSLRKHERGGGDQLMPCERQCDDVPASVCRVTPKTIKIFLAAWARVPSDPALR
jgi:hypothetical protein